MDLFALIAYGIVNLAMIVAHILQKEKLYEFPFWAGVISLGWFFPQAVGGYLNVDSFPSTSYSHGMLFATLCSLGIWGGNAVMVREQAPSVRWMDVRFDVDKLIKAGSLLCVVGFFFQYKLETLPKEVLEQAQWSGAAVKYLFLASIFQFGFILLWLVYLSLGRWKEPRLLLFILPSLFLILDTALGSGRRAPMMNLISYVFISAWFVRRWMIPRVLMIVALVLGLLWINSIEIYRNIMKTEDVTLAERIQMVAESDFSAESKKMLSEGGMEFRNYIFCRQVYVDDSYYDWGLKHWNGLVFNYVPAQIVGRGVKDALMLPIEDDSINIAKDRYGHFFGTGTTATGYYDAFGSFHWGGFIKFWFIGMIMGGLYRYAMKGALLGQLLYVYALGSAMHAITHGTHAILVSIWIYFLFLGFPIIYWAKIKEPLQETESPEYV